MSEVSAWATTVAGNAVAFDDIDNRDGVARVQMKQNFKAIMAATRRMYDAFGVGNSVKNSGAVGDGTTDDTAAFNAAIDAAYSSGVSYVVVPPATYVINGTITMQPGVQLVGPSYSSEYYPSSPYLEKNSATLLKPSTGTAGPIIEMATGSAVVGLYLKHLKVGGATTGIVRFGPTATSGIIYNAVVQNCQVYGHAIASGGSYATASCHGIYSPESDLGTSKQRYGCRIINTYITNCDYGIRLGGQSNGWLIANNIVRQTYRPLVLDGGSSEIADTVISGFQAFNIGALPTATTAVVTIIGSVNILKMSGVSECNGQAFDVSSAGTCSQVDFSDYVPNESIASLGNVPTTIALNGYGPGIVRGDTRQQLIVDPSRTGDGLFQGYGNRVNTATKVSGTLPQLNGTVFDTSSNSKCIVQMPNSLLSKTAKSSFFAKLRVFLSTPSAGGIGIAEVDFAYRVTNQSTGAGSLSVLRVNQKGGQIAALVFVKGATGGTGFRIGITGATGGAVVANALTVALDIDAVTYDANVVAMTDYATITYVATTPTANDVTDAISLLTVADTAI